MEWKKVKSVLLMVLVCANLFLAGNLALQLARGRAVQREAMDQALELLHRDVGDFDDDMFRQMGTQQAVISLPRKQEQEEKAAQALLGSAKIAEGATAYASERGTLSFLGGKMELRLKGTVKGEPEAFFRGLLEDAGFPMKGSRATVRGDSVVFAQYTPAGVPILEAALTCGSEEEGGQGYLTVQGTWLLEAKGEKAGEGERGYQMVTHVRACLKKESVSAPPEKVELAYSLYRFTPYEILAKPVWRVTAGDKVYTIDGLDGTYQEGTAPPA